MRETRSVDVDVESPRSFDRAQLLVRWLLAIVVGAIGLTGGWLVGVLFGLLPLIAAITISSTSSARYVSEVAPRVANGLRWLMQVSAYMLLLVDRFPTSASEPVSIDIRFSGTPTVRSALLRIVTSIPSALVLCVLWWVSAMLWLVAIVTILVDRSVPAFVQSFQRGVLRWQTHLLAYHASLVDEYPPFDFDGAVHDHSPHHAAGASL